MIRYHTVQPANVKDTYNEYDSVDFEMTFETRQLLRNSARIKAGLVVTKSGNAIKTADNIFIDPKIGAHCFVSSITTELQSKGVLENLQEYPRYVRMVSEATMAEGDVLNSENVCELRSPDVKVTNAILQGPTDGKIVNLKNDFSLKPKFCLNAMSGPLSYSRSGTIRVTIKLARYFNALFGPSMVADATYALSNLRLCYMSSVDSSAKSKVQMGTKLNIKQSVASAFSNVSTRVPAVCKSVSCSFQLQADENNMTSNNVETAKLPNVKELQFLFNDSQNEFITYIIKDQEELLRRYVESFADTESNSLSLTKLRASKGFGIGLPFRDFIDLSNQKFNVQITSDVESNAPYIMYMYFHSMTSV